MATEIDEYRNFIDRSSCAGTGKGARMNVFDKSRAESNLFGLCRAKKRCMDMNVFDKSRAESNLFGLCRAKKRCMNEHKIKMLPIFYIL